MRGVLSRVLRRVEHRLRPRDSWLLWGLTLVVAMWPGWALDATGWVRDTGSVLTTTALAVVVIAWPLVGRWPRSRAVAGMALLAVYPVLATTVGQIWPPRVVLWHALAETATWALSRGETGAPLAAWQAWGHVLTLKVTAFHSEVAHWFLAVRGGQVTSGRTVLVLLLAGLVYTHTWTTVLAVRRRIPLLPLFPLLLITGWNAYLAGGAFSWVAGSLGVGTLLAVFTHYAALEEGWHRRRLDYSDQLRLDFGMVGMVLALGVTAASPLLPVLTSPTLHARVRSAIARPWAQAEQHAARLFPDVSRPGRSPLARATLPTLPRSHKLGSSPELLDREVMRVRPQDGPLPARIYWFGQAYDQYTGQGWTQTPWDVQPLDAGDAWRLPWAEHRRYVWHTVRVAHPVREVYAAGLPVAVDTPGEALVYADKDLVGMYLRSARDEYTALGAIPAVDATRLRRASTLYPEWVTSRYLSLPETIPPRVRGLARAVTREAPTAYDRARAIETYLRTIPYSLDVPTPPAGRDVVDWFLFDLRRGYCDYYATAFVVLARLNGLPTRFVIGYAQGTWDKAREEYRITEREAHSWPEVYFPEYGWIPFEPTASREVFRWQRGPGASVRAPLRWDEAADAFRALAARRWQVARLRRAVLGLMGLVGLAALTYGLWWLYWYWRVPQPARGYAQVLWLGRWLGVPLRSGQTPAEYTRALDARLRASGRVRRCAQRCRAWADRAVRAYTRWRYGPRGGAPTRAPTAPEGESPSPPRAP